MTAKIFHAHLYGARESKYERLADTNVDNTPWSELQPFSPFYLFVPQDTSLRAEYEKAWKITEVMPVNVLGFQTHRDHFAIDFDVDTIRKRILDLRGSRLTDDDIYRAFRLKDNRD